MADDLNLYGIVEIMGHRTRAGVLSDAQIGGATLLRIEHPSAHQPGFEEEPLTEYYAPQAIFSIRPCTRDEAERVCSWAWKTEADRTLAALASTSAVDVDDYDDEYAS